MAQGEGELGSVGVEVYGDLTRLKADFSEGRAEAEKFAKHASNSSSKAFDGLKAGADRAKPSVTALGQTMGATSTQAEKLASFLAKTPPALEKVRKGHDDAAKAATEHTRKMDQTSKGLDEMERKGERAGRAIRGAANALFAYFAASSIIGVVSGALDNAQNIKRTSEELGVSTVAWQKYTYAANEAGVSNEDLRQGMVNLQRAMGSAAAGSKLQSSLFQRLGIDLKDAGGNAKSVDQVFVELADRLRLVGNANERAAAQQILFGQSAAKMNPLLKMGAAGITELGAAAEQTGAVLSDEQIQSADETARKLEMVKNVLQAQIAGVVTENASSILTLANALATLTGWLIKAGAAYVSFFSKIGAGVGGVVTSNASPMNPNPLTRTVARGVVRAYGRDPDRPTQAPKGNTSNIWGDAITAVRSNNTGGISLDNLRAPKAGGGGGRGRTRSDPSARQDLAFENEMARLRSEELQIMQKDAGSIEARAEIAVQLLDIERDRFLAALDLQVRNKRYQAADAALIREKFLQLDAAKREQISAQKQAELTKQDFDIRIDRVDADIEITQGAQALAATTAQRVKLERELHALQFQRRRLALQQVEADSTLDVAKRDAATAELKIVDLLEEQGKVLDQLNALNPVEKLFFSLQRTTDQIDEVYLQFAAGMLQERIQRSEQTAHDIADAGGDALASLIELKNPIDVLHQLLLDLAKVFTDLAVAPMREWLYQNVGGKVAEGVTGMPAGPQGMTMKALEDAAQRTGISLDDLNKGALEQIASSGALATAMGNAAVAAQNAAAALSMIGTTGGGGGGVGGLIGSILGVGAGFSPSLGLQADVAGTIAANPSIFKDGGYLGAFAGGGGLLRGPGTGRSDSILARGPRGKWARFSDGEFIVNAEATSKHMPFLEAINSNRLPSMDSGFSGGTGGGSGGSRVSVSFGDIVVPGATDERAARRAAKHIVSRAGADIARVARQGMMRND